ncbi:uncharacterized protein [Panulirus ornatus]|uniref:uncharacterized protein n=1 Tax=Panulirus ornatus TaxID=150431 RepID=UPI003A8B8508
MVVFLVLESVSRPRAAQVRRTMLSVWIALVWVTSLVAARADQSALFTFAYGVRDFETGDFKSHQQSASPSGRIEGEYRWLKPNGRVSVTRYFVDEKSGYRAIVTEEPGPEIHNINFKSLKEVLEATDSLKEGGEKLQSEDSNTPVFPEDPGRTKSSDHQLRDVAGEDAIADVATEDEVKDLRSSEVSSATRVKRSWPFSESEIFSRSST